MTVSADPVPSHPVLFINPRSGGGKAQHHHLVDHCRQKRIEPIVLEEGDDLASLAAAAVSSGADAIGMAGGDGSQGEVAAVAAAHDLPYICVPAGTRNHFALDIRHRPRRCRRRPRRLPPRIRTSYRPGPGQRPRLRE